MAALLFPQVAPRPAGVGGWGVGETGTPDERHFARSSPPAEAPAPSEVSRFYRLIIISASRQGPASNQLALNLSTVQQKQENQHGN